jgi:2-alkenal reductase
MSSFACQFAANLTLPKLPANTDHLANDATAPVVATISADITPQMTDMNAPAPAVTNAQSVPVTTTDLEQTLVFIYQQVNPAVVHIFVYDNIGSLQSTGSGFVIDNNGYIVTNNHVVAAGGALEVVFASGQRREAQTIGTDIDSDLAVIQVDDLPADVSPIPLGDSGNLLVGQFVVAIGNPFGEAGSMSVGIISALDRTIESQRIVDGGFFSIPQVIQTDAAINPGNSGGPLLNLNGEVVGVNSAILTRTGENSGVGFSIPVNAVRRIAPAIIANGVYAYPYMGISMWSEPFTLAQLEGLGLPPNGVYVTSVGEDTPAAAAGIRGNNLSASFSADGDYILAIDGQSVRNSDDLLSYLVFETDVGQTVNLTILRDGRELVLPLTLGERP